MNTKELKLADGNVVLERRIIMDKGEVEGLQKITTFTITESTPYANKQLARDSNASVVGLSAALKDNEATDVLRCLDFEEVGSEYARVYHEVVTHVRNIKYAGSEELIEKDLKSEVFQKNYDTWLNAA